MFCRCWVDTLVTLLSSSWDRTRLLSYSILVRFPVPFPGFPGIEGATRLSREGLRLAGSARQRESDRGALILRLVSVAYVRGLKMKVPLVIGDDGREYKNAADVQKDEEEHEDAMVVYLEELCAVLSRR